MSSVADVKDVRVSKLGFKIILYWNIFALRKKILITGYILASGEKQVQEPFGFEPENTVTFWVKVEILGIFWVNGKIFGWEKILRSQRQHFGLHKKTWVGAELGLEVKNVGPGVKIWVRGKILGPGGISGQGVLF